ncbi:3-deoxy-manno-octulosonate cytidylyltransferase [bacterium]|nr:MAG: 3-deoxy-manno-octulosonate cytidylyltransferase [bacterium]
MNYYERQMTAVGIIPARLSSTRFPKKLLQKINGKSLIALVYENALKSNILQKVIIATEDEEIVNEAIKIGAEYILTPDSFSTGTDRIAWAYRRLELDHDIIFNIQGDEPLLSPALIDKLFVGFSTSLCQVGTLVKKIDDEEELNNPNVVKVVRNIDGEAMYFSRSAIPYFRDKSENFMKEVDYWKHIGLYAYRAEALELFSNLERTDLEVAENLEQLRLLQTNHKYYCMETKEEILGIDTPEDFEKLKLIL